MLLSGARAPSPAMLEKLAEHLRLTSPERRYLQAMVATARQPESGAASAASAPQLRQLADSRSGRTSLSATEFATISTWYFFVLRELVACPGFDGTVGWLRARMRGKVSTAEIVTALRTLRRLGHLEKGAGGRWRRRVDHVCTSFDIPSAAIRRHHREMMARAAEALAEQPVAERDISSVTLQLDARRLLEAKRVLNAFRDDFTRQFSCGAGEAVFQLNLQFFAHTTLEPRPEAAAGDASATGGS
jgi:uncharacterized protein (TIGR02147 family)